MMSRVSWALAQISCLRPTRECQRNRAKISRASTPSFDLVPRCQVSGSQSPLLNCQELRREGLNLQLLFSDPNTQISCWGVSYLEQTYNFDHHLTPCHWQKNHPSYFSAIIRTADQKSLSIVFLRRSTARQHRWSLLSIKHTTHIDAHSCCV